MNNNAGERHVIIEGPHDLASFIVHHRECMIVCHDAAVDFHLARRYLERHGTRFVINMRCPAHRTLISISGKDNALEWWWEVANRTRLRDTSFLDTLIRCAYPAIIWIVIDVHKNEQAWPRRPVANAQ